jgi:prepilin-type processing-associated H-X9-DG protein
MPDGPNIDGFFEYLIFAISIPFVVLTLDRAVRAIRYLIQSRHRTDTVRAFALTALFVAEVLVLAASWRSYTWEELQRSAPFTCASNFRHLGIAMMEYEQDNDDAFPSSLKWADAVAPYTKDRSVFHCPMSPRPYGYSMNDQFSGTVVHNPLSVNGTVLLFETDQPSRNAHGGLGNVAANRHYGKSNYAFVDGRVRRLSVEEVAKLKWHPSATPLTPPDSHHDPR